MRGRGSGWKGLESMNCFTMNQIENKKFFWREGGEGRGRGGGYNN